MDFNNLSVEEKIGQKFMFGVNSSNIDIIIELIKENSIGGVILYKKNYSNYNEMISVIKRLKKANKNNSIPLFIAIDQEGGRVNRMPSEFKNIKNVYDMSKINEDLIYDNANVIGEMLSQMGINMNFAPLLDIYDNDKSKVLYKRCFYGDCEDVYRIGMKYVNGLSSNGVISVIKHYPGHGVSKMDSHFITPYIRDKKLFDKHIIPFDKALNDKNNNIDAVMVGHLVIGGLTGGFPASISRKFIVEHLRKRNDYDGLVITDEMNMLNRNILYKFNYINKMFSSDSDIYLIKIKSKKEAVNIINKYIYFANKNKDYLKLLDDNVNRIINVKNKYNINDDIDNIGIDIDEINNEIDRINNMC